MNSGGPGDCDLDLYDDILVEDLECKQESLHEVQIKYQEALKRIAVLEGITRQNETDIDNLKKKNTYLMKNISVLYKTACTELERKKEIIKSLQNQLASGFEYEEDCRNRMATYPYKNMFEPQNIEDPRYDEESPAPYNNPSFEVQDPNLKFMDSHNFYSPQNSNYPNNTIKAFNTDAHHSTQVSQSSYTSSNIPNKERSEKHSSQSKSHSHTAESPPTDSHTPPIWNTDSHDYTWDSSAHASHSRYSDKHTPHTKQTDSSVSHSKHSSPHLSSRRHSVSKSSHSRRQRSKTPTSSLSDNRSSSSKRSHSDSQKHRTHRSSSHTSEPHSSQSKQTESKKSGHSSRISSKDRETPSSSSRSRPRRSHSTERSDAKPTRSSHRSSSSEKYQDSQSNKQEQKVERGSVKDENSATSKRKLPKEFSVSSRSKRKHKEKSKLPEQNASQCPEAKQILKSHVEEDRNKNLFKESSKYNNPSLQETDSQVSFERTNKDADLDVLRDNSVHDSPALTVQTEEDMPMEVVNSPLSNRPADMTPQTVTDSQSLESVTNKAADTAIPAQKSTSSTSGNSSHESDIVDTECNAEKDLDKFEELDIETNETCTSILWASKNLCDSDENCLEDGIASEVDKQDSSSDGKKDEQSDHSSDNSDNKSDSSSDQKKQSIVIQCFGDTQDNSRSPIIIPCYPSKKSKSKSCSSVSDTDEECDSESHLTSTPSKRLISRSLFPVNEPLSEKLSDISVSCRALEVKINVSPSDDFLGSDKDECLQTISDQASEEHPLLDAPGTQTPHRCDQIELNDNEDFECSPILRKESDDLELTTGRSKIDIWQNGDAEKAPSSKEDGHSESGSDDNDNENCFRQITAIKSLDKKDDCSEDELEEGELLTDEENESDAATTSTLATARSPVRHKSFSPLECRKSSANKSYREDYRKRPLREHRKSNPHNRQKVSPDRFKTRWQSGSGKHSRYRDGGSSQNRTHFSGSGSRSQSRWLDGRHRQLGFNYKRSSSGNRKRTY